MQSEFAGVLLIGALALAVAAGFLALQWRLSPRRVFPSKQEPFECGESPIVSPGQRFSVKFYLVAMLFVIFDIEARCPRLR